MCHSLSRRGFLMASAIAAANPAQLLAARQGLNTSHSWSLPIRDAGATPGDGFLIRHGFACENTWYNPGWWHTAEDWYRLNDIESGGANVLAVNAGEVMWIGSDYPGRVVLVLHRDGLYSMYGHLDYAVDVVEGQQVEAGQVLGRVLFANGWRAPSHLHFEIRSFFYNEIINGDAPRYDVGCGYQCPPGPGYWPIDDPLHPVELGWRNPAHVIHAGFGSDSLPFEAVVAEPADGLSGPVRSMPDHGAPGVGNVTLRAGDRFGVTEVVTGDPAAPETSALAYRVWYRIEFDDGTTGWLPALMADDRDTGSDGRPSSLRPVLLPVTD